jgi:hypothetical protein
MSLISPRPSPAQVQHAMSLMDIDGNGEVSQYEFADVFTNSSFTQVGSDPIHPIREHYFYLPSSSSFPRSLCSSFARVVKRGRTPSSPSRPASPGSRHPSAHYNR